MLIGRTRSQQRASPKHLLPRDTPVQTWKDTHVVSTTTFDLIRHGETDWNVRGLYQGSSDIPLNDNGRDQARQLADGMSGEQWDVIVSSPLSRAMDTAKAAAGAIGIAEDDIIPDARVQERNYGAAEGMTIEEREHVWPEGDWPDLETWEDVAKRGMEALFEYAAKFPGKRIIIVAHGGLINSVLATISDGEVGTGKTPIQNTGRTQITLDGETWTWGEISVVDHLEVPAD